MDSFGQAEYLRAIHAWSETDEDEKKGINKI
jgi:hypothetical protein